MIAASFAAPRRGNIAVVGNRTTAPEIAVKAGAILTTIWKAPMTNDEMLDKVKAAIGKPMSISMSKAGTFLTIGNEPLGEITTEQACIMWDLMPLLAGSLSPVGQLRDPS
jgi:hypothetical protein